MHAQLDEARMALGESLANTTTEPGELAKVLKEKFIVTKANILHDIDGDPNQFVPEDELPRGRDKRVLDRRVERWQDGTDEPAMPPTSFVGAAP